MTLHEGLRLTDSVERAASRALRDGDPGAVGYWADHHRIHPTNLDAALTTACAAPLSGYKRPYCAPPGPWRNCASAGVPGRESTGTAGLTRGR